MHIGTSSSVRSAWAKFYRRVYEVDPLECPCCGGQMKIVRFIERCQAEVIERILRHCGRLEGPIRTNATARAPPDRSHRVSADPPEPQFGSDPDYHESESLESASRKSRADATRELQLVLDPEFL